MPTTHNTVYASLSLKTDGQSVNCSTQPFLAPPPSCPGDQLTFQCAAMDNSTDPPVGKTAWSNAGNSVSECILLHRLWRMNTSRECGSHAQAIVEFPTDCFISTLSGTSKLDFNGTVVICSTTVTGSPTEIGREVIIVIG